MQGSYNTTGWGKSPWHHLPELAHSTWHTVPHNSLVFELERCGFNSRVQDSCAPASPQFYHKVVKLLLFHTPCHHNTGFFSTMPCLQQFLFLHIYFCILFNRKSTVTATVSQWHFMFLCKVLGSRQEKAVHEQPHGQSTKLHNPCSTMHVIVVNKTNIDYLYCISCAFAHLWWLQHSMQWQRMNPFSRAILSMW